MTKTTLAVAGILAMSMIPAVWAQPGGGISRLDTDGDGLVSEMEFAQHEPRRGPRILERADADGDGAVNRDEVQAAIDEEADERESRMREHMLTMFDVIDANEDGLVTREEAQTHAFNRLDRDGDGYISEEEAQAMKERRGERRQRSGKRSDPT